MHHKLASRSRVDLIELKLKLNVNSFFKQCQGAFFRRKPELAGANYKLKQYDCIIFASPVWAFTIAPALRSYLTKLKNLQDKKSACLLTYGSGAGSAKALRELEGMVRGKNTYPVFSKNLSGSRTNETDYLEQQLKPLLEIINRER